MNSITYSFSPNETKKISFSPGNYEYRASAPGVIPDIGSESLASNMLYSWKFYIVSGRMEIPVKLTTLNRSKLTT
jgi:hypothetical protein